MVFRASNKTNWLFHSTLFEPTLVLCAASPLAPLVTQQHGQPTAADDFRCQAQPPADPVPDPLATARWAGHWGPEADCLLAGVSSVDQMHLLALADTLSHFSADVVDKLAQANAGAPGNF